MALVKYNNNSISSVTALDSMASGSLVLLATNTISSGVSSSSFTSNINSTYDTYLFKFINIHPATDAAKLQVNFRDGSSAFDATKNTTVFNAQHNEAGSSTELSIQAGNDIAQGTGYQTLFAATGTDNDQSASGCMYLFNPSSTTFVKHFIGRIIQVHGDEAAWEGHMAGYVNTTSAIDEVRFKASSGNIDAGDICLYGIL